MIDIDIADIIDNFLEEESRPKTVGVYFPSESGMCMRRSYYSYISPKPTDKAALRIFALGNNVHSFIAEALKSSDVFSYVEEEKPLKIEYKDSDTVFNVYGRIDDYVITKDTNKKIIIEAKSVGEINKINEPEPKHVMQLMLYLGAEQADYGLLVYADKKNLNIRQFRVDYDDEMYNKVIGRFKDLDLHLKNKRLPPAEFYFDPKKSWECKYCPYFNDCMQAIANEQ
ncbi:MAG: PD-(D/E)XK nuclease family protein [Candidatus Parvarchaeota archaeon]|nr:PD-(D/E)XK nuclease family protein [Candidatus Parvarchaeota archaeon]